VELALTGIDERLIGCRQRQASINFTVWCPLLGELSRM
jgi:hypothetical protein